jgi:hypothetical protein
MTVRYHLEDLDIVGTIIFNGSLRNRVRQRSLVGSCECDN